MKCWGMKVKAMEWGCENEMLLGCKKG